MAEQGGINAVALLPVKRKRSDLNWQLCIICQTSAREKVLPEGTVTGIDKIKTAYNLRVNHNDTSYENTLSYLQPYINTLPSEKPKWHKSCYASFTSNANLKSMVKRQQKILPGGPIPIDTADESATLTRQTVVQVSSFFVLLIRNIGIPEK